jgi:hypothetical protein
MLDHDTVALKAGLDRANQIFRIMGLFFCAGLSFKLDLG